MSFDAKKAGEYVHKLLIRRGPLSSEDLTLACKEAGFIPGDDRAFGAVYSGLSRAGKIRFVSFTTRKRGHGTAGGRIWAAS